MPDDMLELLGEQLDVGVSALRVAALVAEARKAREDAALADDRQEVADRLRALAAEHGQRARYFLSYDADFLYEVAERIAPATEGSTFVPPHAHEIVWSLDADHVTSTVVCLDEDCIHRYVCPEACEVIYDVKRAGEVVTHGLLDWEGEIKPHRRHEMVKEAHCNLVEFLNADRYLIPELYDGGDKFEIGRTPIVPVWQGEDGALWKRALGGENLQGSAGPVTS